MADILVTSPFHPFTLPNQFKAVFNGYIYCGTVDAVDPSVSQVQVYLVNESGDKVPVAQPLRTNAGGYMVYNGQPAKFVTDSNHSLLVQDSFHIQVWYEPDMANFDPNSFLDFLSSGDGASAIGYQSDLDGSVVITADKKFDEIISVCDFGASSELTMQENKAALQAAISSADGAGVKILVPSYINYGYIRTSRTTWPDFSGLSSNVNTRICIEDYSPGNSYSSPSRDGSQVRRWYYTGAQEDGSHDGNAEWIRSGWHPALMIMHDGDRAKMAAGAGVNRRASVFLGTEGDVKWRIGQGRITDNDATEDELAQYIISANGMPDIGVTGLTTCFVINKTDGAFGFNVGVPRFPFDFMSRVGQPSVGVFGFETPSGEATLRLAGVSSDLRINCKPTSGVSITDSTGTLLDVNANGSVHSHRRTTAGNVALELKTASFARRISVRNDNGSLVIGNLAFASNIVTVSDTELSTTLIVRPEVDATQTLGTSTRRWSVVYASTGTINTSDAREKTAPLPIDDVVLDAWGDVQFVVFQWLDRIRDKGEDLARWHVGVIAQQVRDAFLAHGIDGTEYGLLCYDEWDDEFESIFADREVIAFEQRQDPETGTITEIPVASIESYDTGERKLVRSAGNRWGIRADQCLFMEAAYQRRRCERIEARLDAAGI